MGVLEMEFQFTNEDLKFNQQGAISPRQKEWMEKNVVAAKNFSRVTLWIVIVFFPMLLCFIVSLLFSNENMRTVVMSASPVAWLVLGLFPVFIAGAIMVGMFISRQRTRNFLEARLMVAEGRATLHTTHNPHYGTGYFMMLDDTKIGIVWRDKFEEDQRYRVYYCKSRDGYEFLMSFERLS
jgi:hypothetical protein